MIIKNANVFLLDRFEKADIKLEGDRIVGVGHFEGDGIDAEGLYAVPGFVDIHIHGADDYDFCDATVEGLGRMARYLGKKGVTSFLATSLTVGEDTLMAGCRAVRAFRELEPEPGAAVLRGINMEGPYINPAKKGAQPLEFVVRPDYEQFRRLNEASGGVIKLCDIAPEVEGSKEFMEKARGETVISIAHTAANYDQAVEALHNGATHITHLYNAMNGLGHREPGVVGAAADYAEYAELITDGLHVHPAAVRAAFKLLGYKRICIISDALRAMGMADGAYELGGHTIIVKDGLARLTDGTIAGGCNPVSENVRRAISFGIDPVEATYSGTVSPAKSVGLFDEVGSIEPGKRADIVLMNPDFTVERVIIGGK